jgi:Uma2 family endonuclease
MTTATLPRPKAKASRIWTYDEMIAELPETNQPVELWNGEIVMSPAPHPNHQRIVGKFYKKLDRFVEERELGEVFFSPVDVVLTQHRVVQPDVVFISNARRDIVQDRIQGVPDLVMEVISEGSWQRDRIQKKALYEQFGLPEYWLIDPDSRTVEAFALVKGAYQLHSKATGAEHAKSKLLAGFKISFSELLA